MRSYILLSISFLGLLGFTASNAVADSVEYSITVNTSSEIGDTLNSPNIEFQFSPSSFPSDSATAEITNFSISGGALVPPATNIGGSSGQLPGTVTQTNVVGGSDYTEGIQFGNSLTFNLILSGTAVGSSATGFGGGQFTLDFFDNNGYLFTADPLNDGPVFTVDLNPDGSTTPTSYSSVVSYSGPGPVTSGVPEPSTWLLLSGGLIGVAALVRRRAHASGI